MFKYANLAQTTVFRSCHNMFLSDCLKCLCGLVYQITTMFSILCDPQNVLLAPFPIGFFSLVDDRSFSQRETCLWSHILHTFPGNIQIFPVHFAKVIFMLMSYSTVTLCCIQYPVHYHQMFNPLIDL